MDHAAYKDYLFVRQFSTVAAERMSNIVIDTLHCFDEIFFIDLPDYGERKEIFKIHFKKRKREPQKFDLDKLSQMCGGFSGAEIEEIIISAMYNSFPENRDITTEDIINCIRETIPLSKIMREKIDALRQWAKDRARPASPVT